MKKKIGYKLVCVVKDDLLTSFNFKDLIIYNKPFVYKLGDTIKRSKCKGSFCLFGSLKETVKYFNSFNGIPGKFVIIKCEYLPDPEPEVFLKHYEYVGLGYTIKHKDIAKRWYMPENTIFAKQFKPLRIVAKPEYNL